MNEMIDKRELIVQAAISLFVKRGFDDVSIADIVQAADVSKGALYYYFSSKDHLITQVFWRCHKESEAACMEGLDKIPDAADKLCRRLRNIVAWAIGHPDEHGIVCLYFSSPQYTSKRGYQYHLLHFEGVDGIVREGLKKGQLREMPPILLGELFYNMAAAVLNFVQSDPEMLNDEDFWKTIGDTLYRTFASPDKDEKGQG